MKKSTKKLQLSRETLSALTTEQKQLAAGGLIGRIGREPQMPATSDSKNICCA